MRQIIQEHLSNFNLDIRETHNARFMDQKVTPDVLSFIAECVVNYIGGDVAREFSVIDIWKSQYFISNAQLVFSKPSPVNRSAQHEYDKFISQPLKALGYARVLDEKRQGRKIHYTVASGDILNYIATDARSAYNFLCEYLIKVLQDSEFYGHVLDYERLYRSDRLTNGEFNALKRRFQRFIIGNTPIGDSSQYNGVVEVNRIFPKVLNIIATDKIIPGTAAGRLSPHEFYYSDLMYNRPNWRDMGRDRRITRQEAAVLAQSFTPSVQYRINRAKNFIRNKYTSSELRDQWGEGPADHVHHIFPVNEHPVLTEYLENLIKLTATQHLSRAHPSGNTSLVEPQYQRQCLIAKSLSIEESLRRGEFCYRKEWFIYVINTGYTTNLSFSLSMDSLRREIQNI